MGSYTGTGGEVACSAQGRDHADDPPGRGISGKEPENAEALGQQVPGQEAGQRKKERTGFSIGWSKDSPLFLLKVSDLR